MPVVSTGQLTLVDTNDGTNLVVSRETIFVPSLADGSVITYAGLSTTFKVMLGAADVSSSWKFFVSALGTGVSYRDSNDTADRVGTGAVSGLLGGTVGMLLLVGATQDNSYLEVTASRSGYPSMTRRVEVVKAKSGSDGAAGADAIVGFLTNESAVVSTDSSGNGGVFASAGGVFTVYEGIVNKTGAAVTYSKVSSSGVTLAIAATGVYTVTGMTSDNGTALLRAVYGGVTIDKVYTIAKARAGVSGSAGTDGVRGSRTFYVALSGTTAAFSTTLATTTASVEGGPVLNDVVTQYNNSQQFSETRFYTASGWVVVNAVVDGNLLVSGTVGAAQLQANLLNADNVLTRNLTVRDTAGKILLSSGGGIDASRLMGGTSFSDNFSRGYVGDWAKAFGTGTISVVAAPDAWSGGNVLRLGTDSLGNDEVRVYHRSLIPFNPTEVYRVKFVVRQVAGAGTTFLGVACVKSDGTTMINQAGATVSTGGIYLAASNYTASPGWEILYGFIRGTASTGTTGVKSDVGNPATLHVDTRFIRPFILANYTGMSGQLEVDSVSVEVLTTDLRWEGVAGLGRPEDNATVGAPAGTLVNGVPVATVTTAVANFNSSNDRNSTAVVAPTILADGSAIDHATQADGSVDISFEWVWGGVAGDIDGFIVYVYSTTSATPYNFSTSAGTAYVVPAAKRAFFLFGVAADKYYNFGVRAYRSVDKDINAAGVIQSAIVQPSSTITPSEWPYRPSATVAFSGNIVGTVNGVAAPTLTTNAANGSAAYDGTVNYRTVGGPTASPVITSVTPSQTADGNTLITIAYTYTQGVIKADQLFIYLSTNSTVDTTDPCYVTDASSGSFVFNVKPQTAYYLGVQAVRRTEAGLVGTSIVKHTSGVTTGVANFTGNVNNVAASTLTTDVSTAKSTLADISSDSSLSPADKRSARALWNAAISEKAGINSTAAVYTTITTENTNYNTAIQALGTYLNAGTAYTLSTTTPPSWLSDVNLATSTTVVGSTFRAMWKALYDARQALINKITVEAGKVAVWASVSGVGKPEDGATNGATFGTNISGQITPLNSSTFIANAAIKSAFIESLDAGKITAGTIDAARIAAGSIDATKLNVGFGSNLLDNSTFAYDGDSWTLQQTPDVSAVLGFNLAGWIPVGGTMAYVVQPNATSAGDNTKYQGIYSKMIPVVGGLAYEFSAYLGSHRCKTLTILQFYDAAGAGAGSGTSDANDQGAVGGASLSAYQRVFGFVTAPTNAVSARLFIRKFPTVVGQPSSYMMMTKALVAVAGANQTTPSPWSLGGTGTKITGAGIVTPSLSALSATIGTLRTATTGARMEILDNAIKVYDSNNVLRVQIGDLSL